MVEAPIPLDASDARRLFGFADREPHIMQLDIGIAAVTTDVEHEKLHQNRLPPARARIGHPKGLHGRQ